MSLTITFSTVACVLICCARTYSYETVYKRWPIILTGVIDTIYRLDHELGLKTDEHVDEVTDAQLKEGKAIIEQISKLKYEMSRDRPLEYARLALNDLSGLH